MSNPPDIDILIGHLLKQGIYGLRKEILKAGVSANQRRARRGINPRATRCAVIGFPNVGKSALINRLLGKTMAKSRNLPGVTRQLMWVRLGKLASDELENAIELLDSPGIIPARNEDQEGATRLAICNDIGEASYDRVLVAQALCDRINVMHEKHVGYVEMQKICNRYKIPNFESYSGEEIIDRIAQTMYRGNTISAADKVLGDFRKGYLGGGSLEAPPSPKNVSSKPKSTKKINGGYEEETSKTFTIVESGENGDITGVDLEDIQVSDVGRGNYDGW